jgi:hypothetical protein
MVHSTPPALLRDAVSASELKWRKLDRRVYCGLCNGRIQPRQWSATVERLRSFGRLCAACANGLVGTRGELP